MLDTIALRLALAVILFLVGVYLFRCGVKVRGMIYSNETLHSSPFYETYVKIVRVFCFLISFALSVNVAFNALSFGYQNSLDSWPSNIVTEEYLHTQETAKLWYDLSTWSYIVSIGMTVVMILTAVYLTSRHSPGLNSEKMSGDHPAFKNNKK